MSPKAVKMEFVSDKKAKTPQMYGGRYLQKAVKMEFVMIKAKTPKYIQAHVSKSRPFGMDLRRVKRCPQGK